MAHRAKAATMHDAHIRPLGVPAKDTPARVGALTLCHDGEVVKVLQKHAVLKLLVRVARVDLFDHRKQTPARGS